ncbi:MAG TPA: response regulator [Acidobacteriaceae bacterium]|jgi:CheY-like chemotaxis protein|nr:response regulator [Acidobacteriaceae bacterium]
MPHGRVLIVDDEPLVADTLGLIFSHRGFECKVAYSGEEALAQAHSFAPSLILLDIHMPGMSGLDVARALAVSKPECRMLIMTGYYSKLQEARELSSLLQHPLEFATKPVQPEILLDQACSMLATA